VGIGNYLSDHIATCSEKVYMEIGSFRGGSAHYFSQLLEPEAKIILLEMPDGAGGGKDCELGIMETSKDLKRTAEELREKGFDVHLILHDSKTSDAYDKVKGALGEVKVDVLLIDGGHSINGAASDYEVYKSFVEGMIIFHDCGQNIGMLHADENKIRVLSATGGVFRTASIGHRSLIVQEDYGTGIIWYP
jgi:hypothetical protein